MTKDKAYQTGSIIGFSGIVVIIGSVIYWRLITDHYDKNKELKTNLTAVALSGIGTVIMLINKK